MCIVHSTLRDATTPYTERCKTFKKLLELVETIRFISEIIRVYIVIAFGLYSIFHNLALFPTYFDKKTHTTKFNTNLIFNAVL